MEAPPVQRSMDGTEMTRGRSCAWIQGGLLLLASLLPGLTACVAADQEPEPMVMAEQEKPQAPSAEASPEVLVRFKGDVSPEVIDKINNSLGVKVISVIAVPRIYVVKVPPYMTATELVAKYSSLPEVNYAEPNYPLKLR